VYVYACECVSATRPKCTLATACVKRKERKLFLFSSSETHLLLQTVTAVSVGSRQKQAAFFCFVNFFLPHNKIHLISTEKSDFCCFFVVF